MGSLAIWIFGAILALLVSEFSDKHYRKRKEKEKYEKNTDNSNEKKKKTKGSAEKVHAQWQNIGNLKSAQTMMSCNIRPRDQFKTHRIDDQ